MRLRNRVARGIAWQGGGQALGILSGLAKTVVVARVAPAEEIGVYALALVAVGFASHLGGLGVGTALYHYPDPTRATLRRLFLVVLVAAALIGATGGAIVTQYVDVGPGALALVLAVAVAATGHATAELATTVLSLRLAFATVASAGLVGRLATDAAVVAAVVYRPDAVGLVGGLAAGAAVGALVTAVAALRPGAEPSATAPPPPSRSTLGAILRYGGLTLGETFVDQVISQSDRLILSFAYGVGVLGVYEIVQQVVARPYTFFRVSLRSVYAPLYTRYVSRARALRALHFDYLRTVGLLLAPATVVAVAFGGPLLTLVAGAPYGEYAAAFAALAVLHGYIASGLPIYQYINAAGHVRLSIALSLAMGVVRLSALAGTALSMGFEAALCTYVAIRLAVATLVEWRLRARFFGLDLRASFAPLIAPGRIALLVGVLAYIAYALAATALPSAALWVALGTYAAGYVALNRQALRLALAPILHAR